MKTFHYLKFLLIYIRSFILCLYYLPFRQAYKIPILFAYNFHIKRLSRGGVVIKSEIIERGMISFGTGGSKGILASSGELYVEKGGYIIFHGKATICEGCSIRIDERGVLDIGDNLITLNKNSFIRCSTKITIGEGALIGWNVTINDNDGHYIIEDGIQKTNKGSITIGNHVWIGSHAFICKNVILPNNSIVGQAAVVTKSFSKENVLIAGLPAKIVKQDVNWEQ